MSQSEVLKVLEKYGQLTAKQIAERTGNGVNVTRINLRKLFKNGEVDRIELTKEEVEKMGIKFCGRHLSWKIRKR